MSIEPDNPASTVSATCTSCGHPLRRGDEYVYIEPRMVDEIIYWHKECYDRNVKPFEGKFRPVPKQQ